MYTAVFPEIADVWGRINEFFDSVFSTDPSMVIVRLITERVNKRRELIVCSTYPRPSKIHYEYLQASGAQNIPADFITLYLNAEIDGDSDFDQSSLHIGHKVDSVAKMSMGRVEIQKRLTADVSLVNLHKYLLCRRSA
jgi:hypothetical protein